MDFGFFNRLIIDDVMMYDQQGDSMLYAARISAKIDLIPLTENKISVGSAQLFGLKVNLYQQTQGGKHNFQFVLDSLASKDTTQHTPLDLHIGSLIIRHGAANYNKRYVAEKPGTFSPSHIGIRDLSTHIILNHLTDDAINLNVKKLSLKDKSGLQLNSLSFKLVANQQEATLKDFDLQLPGSDLNLGDIHATYRTENGKLMMPSLQYTGSIEQSKITLADLGSLVPALKHFNDALFFTSHFSGTSTSLRIQDISFKTGSGHINLQANGRISDWKSNPAWSAHIENLNLTEEGISILTQQFGKKVKLPKEVLRLGGIHCTGNLHGRGNSLASNIKLETGAGKVSLDLDKKGDFIKAQVSTPSLALGHILDNKQLGDLSTTLEASGTKDNFRLKGNVNHIDYNQHRFQDITLNGTYNKGLIKGHTSISDPAISLTVEGDYAISQNKYAIQANINHVLPSVLGVKMADKNYSIKDVALNANNKNNDSYIDVESPFLNLHTRGQYNLTSLYASLQNLIADKLPTLPGIQKGKTNGNNDFTLQANIHSTEVLNKMFGIPLSISSPIHINGNISEHHKDVNLYVSLPAFSYNGRPFHGGNIELTTEAEALKMDAKISQGMPYESAPSYHIMASASHNVLATLINYDNHSKSLPIKGALHADTEFSKTGNGQTSIRTNVKSSDIMLGETKWEVKPSTVIYQKNHLTVENFTVKNGDQHIIINGKATPNQEDSIIADLKDVDVAYILNLVNFHSVEFAGKATGKAIVKSIFQKPYAYALLDVNDFTFEKGPLGVLHAKVNYNDELGQIDIKATADDGPGHQTYIDGYVSPKRNYIDLGIEAAGTSMKFMESFCGSFMDDIQAWASGKLNVVGDLSNINLVGDVVARGKMHMKQLNTEYHFDNLKAHAIPDDILLSNDTIYDKNNHLAIVNGGIHHQHLTRLSYDLDLKARNFLGFDTHEFGDNTFYGTIFATGEIGIHGKSGETNIDIDATPEPGSIFVYNVASPDAISDKSFIHWHDATPSWKMPFTQDNKEETDDKEMDIPSDMRINFLVNTNPNLTLKLLMDNQSGDYITLQGNGVIRANYFNKGSFDMFGNYIVNNGVYKLTIQNIIKKEFEFMPGGTISFGGNPYNAPLNLQAKYIINGVPLSDLNIGRSFSSNNIRVDCLMNIQGTPSAPSVDFSMDLPTVNSDAKQMIYSLINSQEEMNQQVLYLLGIGRFYAQAKNNQASEDAAQQSQASLAMQSLLSGTISQQINTVLSSLINNNKWNFGANISTGDEGFNNAEYEGILSGRLLNNRLLFNGQFGYRDNANATQSFIGDFDLRYLIFPNGDLSVRMYNQTNDRYFTKNSLNTQGIGLIIKRDFNGFRDLFGFSKKKRTKQKNSATKDNKKETTGDKQKEIQKTKQKDVK